MSATTPTLLDVSSPTETSETSETSDAQDDVVTWTFDFMENHCYHDPDAVLDDVADWIVDEARDHVAPKLLDDIEPYDWGLLADHLEKRATHEEDEDRAESLEDAAQQIREAMHTYCDCAASEFDWFTDAVDEFLNDLAGDSRALFAVYDGDNEYGPEIAGESLTFNELRDAFGGRGYDAFQIRYTRSTGVGEVGFSDRGWGRPYPLYVVTDPERLDLIDAFLNAGGGYRDEHLVRELRDVPYSPELCAAVEVLSASEMVGTIGVSLEHLAPVDLLAEMRRSGALALAPADLGALVKLAPAWNGTLCDLVGALHAAAA